MTELCPLLVSLSDYCQPKKVLEFGNNDVFLDKSIFPLVSKVVRVTDDKSLKSNDNRLEYVETAPVKLYDYDLILVDGPGDIDKKAKTICYIMRDIIAPVIVITGYDSKQIKESFNRAYAKFIFDFNVVIAHREKLPKAKFSRIQRRIKKHLNKIKDLTEWKPLLQ